VKRLKSLSLISIILTSIFIAAGFIGGSAYSISAAALAFGIIWAVSVIKRWKIINLVCFALFTGLTVYGIWREYGLLLFIAGQIFTIAAWDLADFSAEVLAIQDKGLIDTTFSGHYLYLIMALSLGLIISLLALNIQVQMSFISVLILGVFLIFSLRTLIRIGKGEIGK
jgi:hypothetical protein